jgi:hypothetical protein
MRKRAWIGVLGLALLLAVLPVQAGVIAGAEALITRADEIAHKQGDVPGAIALMKSGLERYPTYPRLYSYLAQLQEFAGLPPFSTEINTPAKRYAAFENRLVDYPDAVRDMFDTFGLAFMNLPDAAEIRKQVDNLLHDDMPLVLGQYGPLALPGDPTPFSYTLADPQLDANQRGGVYQGLITTKPLPVLPALAKDPKYGKNKELYANDPKYGNWTFHWMLLAYDYNRDTKQWTLRFRVMWQDVPGQAEARTQFAQQTAHLLLRLNGLLRVYADLPPLFPKDGVINVWLAERGDAGGEAYDENIYLQQVGTPRGPGEWVREIAHEYGHETLPAVGGYTKPEWAANGRLGERLFVSWLLRNLDQKTETHPWLRTMDIAEYQEARIERPIRQFSAIGPEMPQIRGTDAVAMDAFIGMALYWDMARGSKALAAALKNMRSPVFAGRLGFLDNLEDAERYAQSVDKPVLSLRLTNVPAGVRLWVWLNKGTWTGTFESREAGLVKVKAEVDGKPTKPTDAGGFTTQALDKGWHRIQLIPDGDTLPALTGLRLVRE